MAKNNRTIDRIQVIWNMIGGDDVVDQLIAGAAKLTVEVIGYLTHITTFTLAPTKGSVTIAGAKDVFTVYIDSNFKKRGNNVASYDTEAQAVSVHDMSKEGSIAQLLNLLGDPRSLCLTQGQIVEFCRTHSEQLQWNGYGTFFPFEVKGEVFVANARVRATSELLIDLRRLDPNDIWGVGGPRRLVVKQQ